MHLQSLPIAQSTSSIAYDVNDSGTVVGPAPVQSSEKGFIRTASGKATYYCAPGAGCTKYSSSTYFTGLNDSGVGVGVYKTPEMGAPEGFMLKGSTFATIQEPNSVWGTSVNGINKSNTVVGSYLDNQTNSHGFQRPSSGNYTTLDFPGAQSTAPLGINSSGVIVGSYSSPTQGFTYQAGEWTTLDYPGASTTELNGISDAGVIVGYSYVTTPGTAFLYENGVFKVIAVPNAYSTSVNGRYQSRWTDCRNDKFR